MNDGGVLMKPIVGEIERKIRQGISRTDIMSSLVSDIPLRTRPRSFHSTTIKMTLYYT